MKRVRVGQDEASDSSAIMSLDVDEADELDGDGGGDDGVPVNDDLTADKASSSDDFRPAASSGGSLAGTDRQPPSGARYTKLSEQHEHPSSGSAGHGATVVDGRTSAVTTEDALAKPLAPAPASPTPSAPSSLSGFLMQRINHSWFDLPSPSEDEAHRHLIKSTASSASAEKCQPSLIDRVNVFSRMTFTWANPVLKKGYKGSLRMADLWELAEKDSTEAASKRFEAVWKEDLKSAIVATDRAKEVMEQSRQAKAATAAPAPAAPADDVPGKPHLVLNPSPAPRSWRNLYGLRKTDKYLSTRLADNISIPWTFVKTFKSELIFIHFLLTFYQAFVFLSPTYFLRSLVAFAQDSTQPLWQGLLLVVGVLVNETCRSIVVSQQWTTSTRVASRARSVMYAAVYKKTMRLRTLGTKSVGEVVNLITNDGQRIFDAFSFGSFAYASVVSTIIGLSASWAIIGPFALIGCGIFILFYPIQGSIARAVARQRREAIKITDSRVRLMNELLTCIRLIKSYAWESSFAGKIEAIRQNERKILAKAGYLQSMNLSFTPLVPTLASVMMFTFHSVAGLPLTPANAFSVIAMFNVMRFPLNLLPQAIKNVGEALIGVERLKDYLLMDEIRTITTTPESPSDAIVIKSASFVWAKQDDDIRATGSGEINSAKPSAPSSAPTAGSRLKQRILQIAKKDRPAQSPPENGSSANKDSGGSSKRGGGGGGGGGSRGKKEQHKPTKIGRLNELSVRIEKGHLVGICGAVGSGKTSLLSAIIGQLISESGSVAVGGSIAYVAQQAWIFNASLRENVLFGMPFDEEKYQRVVEACCLQQDISMLPDGDRTEIGERGINLSGGQKQRISLARAVYSDKDIYLLDDPLSAVDAHVGKHIFEECIVKALERKTVLLVTHQLQYLSSCDWLLVMDDGSIAEQGTYEQLMDTPNGNLRSLLHTFLANNASNTDSNSAKSNPSFSSASLAASTTPAPPPGISRRTTLISILSQRSSHAIVASEPGTSAVASKPASDLISKEEKAEGSISLLTYRDYMKAGGGYLTFSLLFLCFLLAMGIKAFSDWWLSYWLRMTPPSQLVNTTVTLPNGTQTWELVEEPGVAYNLKSYPDFERNVLVYCASALGLILFQMVRAGFFLKATLTASATLHRHVFDKVMHAPMAFFDTTPTGRVLNRFSKDMDEVDIKLPFFSEQLLQNGSLILLTIGVVAGVFPWFLIALIPLGAIFSVVNTFFNRSARELKRLDNISRSPIFSHLTATLQGLTTIRAFGMTNHFIREYVDVVDANTRAFFAFYITNRWLAIRLDAITTVVSAITALFIVLSRGSLSPALAGLALSYSLQMSGMFQYTVRLVAETQSRFVSVERIQHYIRTTPQEGVPPALEETSDDGDDSNRNKARAKGSGSASESSIEGNETGNDNDNDIVDGDDDDDDDDDDDVGVGGDTDARGIVSGSTNSRRQNAARFQRFGKMGSALSWLLLRFSRPGGHAASSAASAEPLPLVAVHVERPLVEVSEDWPTNGAIEFRKLRLRYRSGLPLVLKGFDCKIKGKEKIGIVGRTGAGKSSIAVALFRLVEPTSGSIAIDGVDIACLDLAVLRSRLSIIPQDPVLFVGTIRYNLDPFEKYADDAIWDALNRSHMGDRVRAMPLKLETPVVENGENFSVGERQLFCMARALLRHSRILVLDESTSAIDTETDALIQKTIRESFRDCTLLTIAHRLNTILDSDRIIVMSEGRAVEFDTPSALMANPQSVFASMVATSEQSNF